MTNQGAGWQGYGYKLRMQGQTDLAKSDSNL